MNAVERQRDNRKFDTIENSDWWKYHRASRSQRKQMLAEFEKSLPAPKGPSIKSIPVGTINDLIGKIGG